MANVIKHKRGSGSDPVASDLVVGEVAIRTDVGKLFTKMDNGSVAEIAGGGSDIAINTLSSSSATGGGSATFNGSAYRFTLSAPPNVSAAQLLVSINGVIQKPVAGTGQPSEGFSVDGTDIILGDAPATGSDFFILTFKSLGVSEPADNSVTSAKIVDGAIVNADINASAAIDVSKLSGVMPSSGGVFTGDIGTRTMTPASGVTNADIGASNLQYRNIFASGNLTIDTNTLHVDSSNNRVGIGTTSPGELLSLKNTSAQVNMSLQAATNGSCAIFFGDTDTVVRSVIKHHNNDDALAFFTGGNNERMRIDSSGRVGIGTTSPSAKLYIAEAGSKTGGDINLNADGLVVDNSGGNTGITFKTPNTATSRIAFGDPEDNNAGQILYSQASNYFAFDTSGSERLRIDSSGVVSIGTTSPNGSASKLQVEDSGENNVYFVGNTSTLGARLILQNKNSTANAFSKVEGADASGQGICSIKFNSVSDATNEGFLSFETRPANGLPTERMVIDSSGNVSIGASSYGGGGSSPKFYISTTSDRAVKIHNTNSATSSVQITNAATGQGDDNGMQLAALGNGECLIANAEAERIIIMSQEANNNTPVVNFNKPQGPSNAQTTMIAFETGNQGRGAVLSSSSDGGSPSFSSVSDYRIKTNIRDYTNGYDNIKAIPVKLFDMISDGTKDIKGWIAHEVQAFIPEAVMGVKDAVDSDENPILQQLSYGLFMPDVVGALQTAIAKIETLEAKVEALEAK